MKERAVFTGISEARFSTDEGKFFILRDGIGFFFSSREEGSKGGRKCKRFWKHEMNRSRHIILLNQSRRQQLEIEIK